MWSVLIFLTSLLAAGLLLLLAVLMSPLRFELRASLGEAPAYRVAVRLFGRAGPRLTVVDSDRPRRKRPLKPGRKTRRRAQKSVRDPARLLAAAARLLAELFSKLSVERLSLDLRFGVDDPAETGQIFGALTPFIYGTKGSGNVALTLEPVFDQAVLDGRAALDLHLTPARLILPLVRFGWAAFGPRR